MLTNDLNKTNTIQIAIQQVKNKTLIHMNSKIESLSHRLNDLNKTNSNQLAIQQANDQSLIVMNSEIESFSNKCLKNWKKLLAIAVDTNLK